MGHITGSHDYLQGMKNEVLEAVENPEYVFLGSEDELLAAKKYRDKHLIVVYKGVSEDDGFVITAFATSKFDSIRSKRELKWKRNC